MEIQVASLTVEMYKLFETEQCHAWYDVHSPSHQVHQTGPEQPLASAFLVRVKWDQSVLVPTDENTVLSLDA
jgi:hypothetical protein